MDKSAEIQRDKKGNGRAYVESQTEWYENRNLEYELATKENGDIIYERSYSEDGTVEGEYDRAVYERFHNCELHIIPE